MSWPFLFVLLDGHDRVPLTDGLVESEDMQRRVGGIADDEQKSREIRQYIALLTEAGQ